MLFFRLLLGGGTVESKFGVHSLFSSDKHFGRLKVSVVREKDISQMLQE